MITILMFSFCQALALLAVCLQSQAHIVFLVHFGGRVLKDHCFCDCANILHNIFFVVDGWKPYPIVYMFFSDLRKKDP